MTDKLQVEHAGSPAPRKAVGDFAILEQITPPGSSSSTTSNSGSHGTKHAVDTSTIAKAMPLTTSHYGNYQTNPPEHDECSPSKVILWQPQCVIQNFAKYEKKQKLFDFSSSGKDTAVATSINKLLAHLNHQSKAAGTIEPARVEENITLDKSNVSTPPQKDGKNRTEVEEKHTGSDPEASELGRLKKELSEAKYRIAIMDQELSQQHITNASIDQVLRSPSGSQFQFGDAHDQLFKKFQNSPNQATLPAPSGMRKSSASLGNSHGSFESFGVPWETTDSSAMPFQNAYMNQPTSSWQPNMPAAWSGHTSRTPGATPRIPSAPQPQRPGNLRIDTFEANNLGMTGMDMQSFDNYRQPVGPISRPGSSMGGQVYNDMGSYLGSITSTPVGYSPPMTPMQMQHLNHMAPPGHMQPYRQRHMSTALSPTALEFNGKDMSGMNSFQAPPWANQSVGPDSSSAFMHPMEPVNYRRLLDRNTTCNWKYIVDKIVCSNDQQASIFLQQKLKISTAEQKYELVEAIIAQAYPLMINRFGNFLVQRCFEHGTSDQVIAIANAIRGNTLNLSMDAFGCHVVQKAFDVVPEDYKAVMVHELLHRIPETVIHRYACHVWQKLFELRWSDSPPQIMKYVNEALRGMWHEVALGETGSLVVQNIFENCLEEDKRPCINEVLASIDVIAHGQFGNWCVQHICEHGLPADKSRAIEHVLRFATEYSTDQFASKVVEKCLKVGGPDFMDRYLERVCEGRADRPRIPLIDIAGDQYGNYLIQYILVNAGPQHREMVSTQVRKHMVSLRGSKFGSRVAMLCSNPAFSTRPGPPMGMQMNNRFAPQGGMTRGPIGAPYR